MFLRKRVEEPRYYEKDKCKIFFVFYYQSKI